MIVEPAAGDRVEDNFNPVGRARIEEVVRAAGFRHFRQAAATPFNLVFEARPQGGIPLSAQ